MLGTELSALMDASGIDHIGSDREVSILEPPALEAFHRATFGSENPLRWIINCSAYTAVDKAEDEPRLCRELNVTGPANLAALAEKTGASILHVSTDYVFDGAGIADASGALRPYREDDPIAPTGVYGRTKAEGEAAVVSACNRSIILRTSWLYGQHGSNFVITMLRLMAQRDAISVVSDQTGSPTWARDLAAAIIALAGSAKPAYGIYHYSNAGTCSWFDFAREIQRLGREEGLLETGCTINPVTTDQYPTKAKRPAWSVLDKSKIITDYGVAVPQWEESLGRFIELYSDLLGRVTNWLEHADYDLITAENMQQSGRYLYVIITCQQCIEKMMKAVYEFQGKKIPRIHDLVQLSARMDKLRIDEYRELFKDLTYYYTAARYLERISQLSLKINKEWAGLVLKKTREIAIWIRNMFPL